VRWGAEEEVGGMGGRPGVVWGRGEWGGIVEYGGEVGCREVRDER